MSSLPEQVPHKGNTLINIKLMNSAEEEEEEGEAGG